jgi:hypothetical protein
MKPQLSAVRHNDDRAPCHFRSCPAGRGHRNQRRNAFGDVACAALNRGKRFESPQYAICAIGMRRQYRHTLGAVNRRTAAHGNQAITARALVLLGGRHHSCFGWVGGGLIEDCHRHTRQLIQCFLQNACSLDPCVGNDQGLGDADALALCFEVAYCTKVELNLRDVVDSGHGDNPLARYPSTSSGRSVFLN